MFDFLKKSLANRLLVAFIVIGFLPFVIFLVYTLVLSETQIVKKLISDQHHEVEVMSKLVDTHLSSLKKEVSFLARLELMDDVLAQDLDRRVSRLLKQKKDDYALDLDFFFVNKDLNIVASSNIDILDEKFTEAKTFKFKKGHFIKAKKLYIYSKVYASFESEKSLGYLVLEYDLDNLKVYLGHIKDSMAYIYQPKEKLYVGGHANLKIDIKSTKDSISVSKYLVVYRQMDSMLKDWYIFYAVKKDIALAFFYNFNLFMLYLSPFILVLIIFISWKFSRHIVKPIKDLTSVTDEIVYTKDYSRYLDMVSKDEIGRLANSFNTLLNTTDKSIDASEAKSSFISNMSHELKTPLNAIIGFSQYLISYEKLTDEQLDIVSNIENSSQYLLEMIHGILDIAKIEAGKVDVNIEKKDTLALCVECFSMLEPLAEDRGLDFILDFENCDLKFINTDERIFKQIVINLLSNSIKYTERGKVRLVISNTKHEFFLSVIDTGIGIAKEEMDKLFKEFSRIDNGLSSKQKGTGLGLSLSKKLANVLGGDIYLQSDGLKQGTKAVFVLKLKGQEI